LSAIGKQSLTYLKNFKYHAAGTKLHNEKPIPAKNNKNYAKKWYSFSPKLTLLPDKTAQLEYRVYIIDEALEKELLWEYNKDIFSVNIKQKENISTVNNWQILSLEIKCKKEFKYKEYITVKYFKDKDIDKDKEKEKKKGVICGQIEVLPNNKASQQELELVIINVTTELMQGKKRTGKLRKEVKEALTNVGQQALLKFKIKTTDISVAKDNDFFLYRDYVKGIPYPVLKDYRANLKISDEQSYIAIYLSKKLPKTYENS
jgi:hypothetical protein